MKPLHRKHFFLQVAEFMFVLIWIMNINFDIFLKNSVYFRFLFLKRKLLKMTVRFRIHYNY